MLTGSIVLQLVCVLGCIALLLTKNAIRCCCAAARYPGVYSRLSHESNWRFIRFFVCQQSISPPAYLDCPAIIPDPIVTTFSPAPTQAPVAPSVSQAPSYVQTLVTIRILLDFYPQETGWRLETQDGNVVVRDVEIGTYQATPETGQVQVIETLSVNLGFTHRLVLRDRGRDGICCQFGHGRAAVYLGNQIDDEQLLLYHNGEFATLESGMEFVASQEGIIPVPTPPPVYEMTNVTVVVDTGGADKVTWALHRLDGSEKASVAYRALAGPDTPTERTVEVVKGGLYSFTIFHPSFSGFDGTYAVYLGHKYGNSSNVQLVSGMGNQVQRRQRHKFITTEPTRSNLESDLLTLEIRFDSFPSETEWYLKSVTNNEVIAFGPEDVYRQSLKNVLSEESIRVPSPLPDAVDVYQFVWTDLAGDGICCRFGPGFLRLWDGRKDADRLLATSSSTATARESLVFHRSVTALTEPAHPTQSPSPTALETQRPSVGPTTQAEVRLSIKVEATTISDSLGWRLVDPLSGAVLHEALPEAPTAPRSATSLSLSENLLSLAVYGSWTSTIPLGARLRRSTQSPCLTR